MKTVAKMFKNIRNEYLKSVYKDKNFILSLKQSKNSYRELASSRFISYFKKTLESQAIINAVMKGVKYVKII